MPASPIFSSYLEEGCVFIEILCIILFCIALQFFSMLVGMLTAIAQNPTALAITVLVIMLVVWLWAS